MDSARFAGPAIGARRRALRRAGLISAILAIALLGVACGGTQPIASGAAATITSSSSSSPPQTVSPGPTASPTPAPGTAAIAAFVKLVTKATFAYQATFSGRSRHTTDRLPVKGTIAVSGSDYRVTADFMFDAGTASVEHRYVGGKAWVRFEGDTWRSLTGFKPAASMSPFALVTGVEAVQYLGTEKVGGRTVHRVRIASVPLHPSLIPAINLTKETVTRGVLELLMDDAGRPVTGTATIEGTGRVSGQLQEIVIELNLTFTKVGQKVTVRAP